MDWITTSVLMFLFSNVLYLLVRKAQKENLPNLFLNLGMFLIPSLFYLPSIFYNQDSLFLDARSFLIILFTAFFFSYLGNHFSLKSISLSPNPGYSLIISKSYVVFTTLIAVFIFQSEITVKRILAIFLIVVFSGLIVIERKQIQTGKNRNWILYAFGAFFCWGMLALVSKHILSSGVKVFPYLFYLSFFVSIFVYLESKFTKTKFILSKKYLVLLFFIGVSSAFFNLFMQVGYLLAPNPGYINAVNASSISLLTLLSAYFFKDELTWRKIMGVAGVTMGLIILLT